MGSHSKCFLEGSVPVHVNLEICKPQDRLATAYFGSDEKSHPCPCGLEQSGGDLWVCLRCALGLIVLRASEMPSRAIHWFIQSWQLSPKESI